MAFENPTRPQAMVMPRPEIAGRVHCARARVAVPEGGGVGDLSLARADWAVFFVLPRVLARNTWRGWRRRFWWRMNGGTRR